MDLKLKKLMPYFLIVVSSQLATTDDECTLLNPTCEKLDEYSYVCNIFYGIPKTDIFRTVEIDSVSFDCDNCEDKLELVDDYNHIQTFWNGRCSFVLQISQNYSVSSSNTLNLLSYSTPCQVPTSVVPVTIQITSYDIELRNQTPITNIQANEKIILECSVVGVKTNEIDTVEFIFNDDLSESCQSGFIGLHTKLINGGTTCQLTTKLKETRDYNCKVIIYPQVEKNNPCFLLSTISISVQHMDAEEILKILLPITILLLFICIIMGIFLIYLSCWRKHHLRLLHQQATGQLGDGEQHPLFNRRQGQQYRADEGQPAGQHEV